MSERIGFAAATGSGPMCAHLTAHDFNGPHAPRPCKRAAAPGSVHCGTHAAMVRKRAVAVDVREGGFCFACAEPARLYVLDGAKLAICGKHAKALVRAIREGR